MNRSPAFTLFGLAAAGLASAVLSFAFSVFKLGLLGPGAVFGLAIVAYFALCEDVLTRARGALFVCACSAAYAVAEISYLVFSGEMQNPGNDVGSTSLSAGALFGAGTIGAFLVLAPGMLLFGESAPRRAPLPLALLASLGGGLLAVLGGVSFRSDIGSILWLVALYGVWQTGVAATLGALLVWTRRGTGSPKGEALLRPDLSIGSKIVGGVLFAFVIAVVGFYFFSGIVVRVEENRMTARYERVRAEQPSKQGLTPPVPVPPDARCIKATVGDHRFLGASNVSVRPIPLQPPLVSIASCGYRAEYPGARIPILDTGVEVIETPNIDWARYFVKSVTVDMSALCPRCVSRPSQLGGKVVRIADDESHYPLSYLWASGTSFVKIEDESKRDTDAMLHLYLDRYPSDLPVGE